MFVGIETVILPVSDMDKAVEFYTKVLMLAPTYQSSHWTSFTVGGQRIALHLGLPSSHGGLVLCLRCEDLKACRSALERAGASCDGYHETPNGVLFAFRDVDGNSLQAIQIGSSMESFI